MFDTRNIRDGKRLVASEVYNVKTNATVARFTADQFGGNMHLAIGAAILRAEYENGRYSPAVAIAQ